MMSEYEIQTYTIKGSQLTPFKPRGNVMINKLQPILKSVYQSKMRFLLIVANSCIITACSPTPPNVDYTYIKSDSSLTKASDINAQAQLVEAASSVSQSLQQLSSIQQATHPDVNISDYKKFTGVKLDHIASLNWSGPVEPPLQTIANTIHYKFNIIGSKPAIPVLVNIQQSNQQIATILRNINYQLAINHSGSIIAYPSSHILELRYASI